LLKRILERGLRLYEQNCRNSCIKWRLNFKPLEFEGLKQNQKVQRTAAQLPSGQNKKRPPLTMEPSIDDPLAAVTHRIYNSFVSGNTNSKRHTRAGGYPALPHNYFWMPACASMTERRGGMLR
jgi:hypothetical protein